jgi:hypothetical protein
VEHGIVSLGRGELRIQETFRVHAVDHADERRMDAVAEHSADVLGHRANRVAVGGQGERFLGV